MPRQPTNRFRRLPSSVTMATVTDVDRRLRAVAPRVEHLDRLQGPVFAHTCDGMDDHATLVDVREQEVSRRGPCARAGRCEIAGSLRAKLSRRTADDVVDVVDDRVSLAIEVSMQMNSRFAPT